MCHVAHFAPSRGTACRRVESHDISTAVSVPRGTHQMAVRAFAHPRLYRTGKSAFQHPPGPIVKKFTAHLAVRFWSHFRAPPIHRRLRIPAPSTRRPKTPPSNRHKPTPNRHLPTPTRHRYDANGSLTTRKNGSDALLFRQGYDLKNRLVGADADGDSDADLRLAYDYQEGRVARHTLDGSGAVTASEHYLLDRMNPTPTTGYEQVLEQAAGLDGSPARSFVLGLSLILQADGTTLRSFLFDGHGTGRGLVDATGRLASGQVLAYDAFGVRTDAHSAVLTPIQYTGQWFDEVLGQGYHRHRWLSHATGTWNAADSFEGLPSSPLSLHKRGYAEVNPVANHDPSGRISLTQLLVGIGITSVLGGILIGTVNKLVYGGDFTPDAALHGFTVNVDSSVVARGAGAVADFVANNLPAATGPFLGTLQLLTAIGSGPLASKIANALTSVTSTFGAVDLLLGLELVTTRTDRKMGLFLNVGVALSAGATRVGTDIGMSLYTGVVWGVPAWDDYEGAMTVVGGGAGLVGFGMSVNYFFSSANPSQHGMSTSVELGNGPGFFAEGSKTRSFALMEVSSDPDVVRGALLASWPPPLNVFMALSM